MRPFIEETECREERSNGVATRKYSTVGGSYSGRVEIEIITKTVYSFEVVNGI